MKPFDSLTIVAIPEADDMTGFGEEVSMSDEAIQHFGVLGMRWGVRRGESSGESGPQSVVVTQRKPGARLKTKGGKGHSADQDAVSAAASAQKAKKSGIHSLSNEEIKTLVARMNLEQQYEGLRAKQPTAMSQGKAYLKKIMTLGKTANEVHQFASSPVGKTISGMLKK